MKAIVDIKRCDATGLCVRELPTVFRFMPGNKKASVVRNPIPMELAERCLEVAKRCPQGAIIIAKDEG